MKLMDEIWVYDAGDPRAFLWTVTLPVNQILDAPTPTAYDQWFTDRVGQIVVNDPVGE